MYLALEDNAGKRARAYAPANAVGSGEFIPWLIPYDQLTGIDLTKIETLIIGFGDTSAPLKGDGLVYIDDISRGHALE